MFDIYLYIILIPLFASAIVGWGGNLLGNRLSAIITILGVFISFVLSLQVFAEQVLFDYPSINHNFYTWLNIGDLTLSVGILIDELTAVMMFVVLFVSLMVHIYTMGYMQGEKHYTRFFSYISLFTFAMLMLVMSNNFMQLFFGWEAVGLVSYLLIGFYYQKESAVSASLKAFLVNRVGDFGFVLGIGLIFAYAGTLDYIEVFNKLAGISEYQVIGFDLITVIALLLFVGAMGKSAQVPLHIWLPGSMEGPTPISALIHAATMVTAGIFMVSRLSPMFELSQTTLITIMLIGGLSAFFMGLIGLVQNDIKKVIAYSTLSQLGYMTVALGVSAYNIAIFHLFTHAFFKALLFLGAGSVIVALHHEQDIRKMGGLWQKMPITFWTFVIGTLAIIGFPGLAGFYSKDMIIEATHLSTLPYSDFVYYLVLSGVAVTALYSLRLLALVFLGKPRDEKLFSHAHESPLSITIPLILLAIASIVAGFVMIELMLFDSIFDGVIVNHHSVMQELAGLFYGAWALVMHAPFTPAFYLMLISAILALIIFLFKPQIATLLSNKLSFIRKILENLYYFDKINDVIFVRFTLFVAKVFNFIDEKIIDKILVDSFSSLSKVFGRVFRVMQTGYVYHYGFFMIISTLIMLSVVLLGF
jgi:NADH-quinone oxidoreductase subunit L